MGTATGGQATPRSTTPPIDMPTHPLLTPREQPPRIETRVSKVMRAPLDDVFAHFWGSEPRLRVDLHRDHVKSYHIHHETPDTLEYEFVFEAYGTRNWGKAVEVAHRPNRIDVEVKAGPLTGQTVTTLLRPVEGGTEVTQVNRVWPGDADMMVKLMGNRLRSQLAALAGVHLEQHRADIEGEERFQDRFSRRHQEELAHKRTSWFVDILKTTRAITLPIILLPLIAAAGLALGQSAFSPLALALTVVGGGAALMAANLVNDLWDFRHGADQSARNVPGAIETGSGAFVEGRWSTGKGWGWAASLGVVALACGGALAALSTPWVLAFAAAGAAIAYVYVGPPFPLAYKGHGLGEAAIFAAFGVLPVVGGVWAHGGASSPAVWWFAALYGLTSTIVLYHHHFLHWQADRIAGKGSPVALLGPRRGAAIGVLLCAAAVVAIAAAALIGPLPPWSAAFAVGPALAWPYHLRILRGANEPTDMVRLATAAFFGGMLLSGMGLAAAAWWA